MPFFEAGLFALYSSIDLGNFITIGLFSDEFIDELLDNEMRIPRTEIKKPKEHDSLQKVSIYRRKPPVERFVVCPSRH